MHKTPIPCADLTWVENCHPHSRHFDDHYYSLIDGLKETQHVFISGNDLLNRWQQLTANQSFCIMETGFGSGLNFLATWQLWNHYNFGKNNKLHFISVESYPMTAEQLEKSLLNWQQQLGEYSQQLLTKYPALIKGQQDIFFDEDSVTLTLFFTEIGQLLPDLKNKLSTSVDAWFLDGFAPSKNPEMWQPELFKQMALLSSKDATVATYTVAGMVRRGLSDAGFIIDRKPGYGTKRQMLAATMSGNQ